MNVEMCELCRPDTYALRKEYAKLIFTMGRVQNWVDPDNYGEGHSYMQYLDSSTDLGIRKLSERLSKQKDAIMKFQESCHGKFREKIYYDLDLRQHRKSGHNACLWSDVEKFRYLEELYKINPNLFPDLSKDQFESLKNEFYANQPIILTLPLVKG